MNLLRLTLLLALLGACRSFDPKPQLIAPPDYVPLNHPLRDEILAVVDFEDVRPEQERRKNSLNDTFLRRVNTPGYYWAFQGSELQGVPTITDADGDVQWVRMTGDNAYLWHPYPHLGTGAARTYPTHLALADYFALTFERRGVVDRVVRVSSLEQARAAGATLVVEGTVQHFACAFTEVRDLKVERSDDIRYHHIYPWVALDLSLRDLHDERLLWAGTLDAAEPDHDHLTDHLTKFNGTKFRKLVRMQPTYQTVMGFQDMVAHVRRSLHDVTDTCMAEVETALGETYPLD